MLPADKMFALVSPRSSWHQILCPEPWIPAGARRNWAVHAFGCRWAPGPVLIPDTTWPVGVWPPRCARSPKWPAHCGSALGGAASENLLSRWGVGPPTPPLDPRFWISDCSGRSYEQVRTADLSGHRSRVL